MPVKIVINGPLFPYTENDSRLIEHEVSKTPNEDFDVFVHSPGGSIWEGKKLFHLFNNLPGKVRFFIPGLAGSAASSMCMAGDELHVYEYSEFMMHSAMTCFGFCGNAKQLEEAIPKFQQQIPALKAENKVIAGIYAKRAKIDISKVIEWMDVETTFHGEEIVKMGLATHLIKTPARGAGKTNMVDELQKFDLSAFQMHKTSAFHKPFGAGIEPYMSWQSVDHLEQPNDDDDRGGAPEGTVATGEDVETIQRIARNRAVARNRLLRINHPESAAP